LDPKEFLDEIQQAFSVWENEMSDLKFEFVPNSEKNMSDHIILEFGEKDHGDGTPFDGQGGALAHACKFSNIAV